MLTVWPFRKRKPVTPPSQYDILKVASYRAGAEEMRDVIVARLTWYADSAPNPEACDYLWRILMETRELKPERYRDWPW
jgi:hypothetical protein